MSPWDESGPAAGYGGALGEAGGDGDLQTDVMRFMAMLGLCLVAIFALMQSLPPAPLPAERKGAAPEERAAFEPAPPPRAGRETGTSSGVSAQAPITHSSESGAVSATRTGQVPADREEALLAPEEIIAVPVRNVVGAGPREVSVSAPMAAAGSAPRGTAGPAPGEMAGSAPRSTAGPAPKTMAGRSSPPARGAATGSATAGVMLRFASDDALLRLVRRGQVGFYAVDGAGGLRLLGGAGGLAFRAAPLPSQLHDMEPASVPAMIRRAYLRARGQRPAEVRWGVLLPAPMRARLEDLAAAGPGELVIAGDGEVSRAR